MAFVIDASIAAAWAFGEEHEIAELALARAQTEETFVPALWWYELRNVLIIGERRRRLTEQQTVRFLRSISRFPIEVDNDPGEIDVLVLARRHRLTVYDAAYLELAMRGALPLATLDAALARAARTEGSTLIGA